MRENNLSNSGNPVDGDESAEQKWQAAASINNYNCSRCGEAIIYVEKDFFFDTKLCTYCYQVTSKDD